VTKRDFADLEFRLNTRIRELELRMESVFREMEIKLTIKMGAITSVVVGFFYVLEKFF
jgi:cell division FtsZ-interacting protein ZapD